MGDPAKADDPGGARPGGGRARGRSGSAAGAAGATPPPPGDAAGTQERGAIIKKYANRRLYDTGASRYVTLEDLARMVREGRRFTVVDARGGEDITRSVLGQIIFEQEAKGDGPSLLPTEFLRRVISYYGDGVGAAVPSYLEASMRAFERGAEEMREELGRMAEGRPPDPARMVDAGLAPLKLIEEQTRRNAEAFTAAMRMFVPFGGGGGGNTSERAAAGSSQATAPSATGSSEGDEMAELREQIAAMQRKVDRLGE